MPKVSGSMHFAYCACAHKRSGRHATRVSNVTSGNPINFDPVPGVCRLSETNADSADPHDPHDVDLILSASSSREAFLRKLKVVLLERGN